MKAVRPHLGPTDFLTSVNTEILTHATASQLCCLNFCYFTALCVLQTTHTQTSWTQHVTPSPSTRQTNTNWRLFAQEAVGDVECFRVILRVVGSSFLSITESVRL